MVPRVHHITKPIGLKLVIKTGISRVSTIIVAIPQTPENTTVAIDELGGDESIAKAECNTHMHEANKNPERQE